MTYCFDKDIAKRYGVDAAVMLWNLDYWIQKNKANGKHFYDGLWWTYNSAKAFAELFPFWSAKQVTRILTKLKDEGVIVTGNYNETAYDRTLWYAIRYDILEGKSTYPNGEIHLPKRENGNTQTGEPIPNIQTNIFPDDKKIGDDAPARTRKYSRSLYHSFEESEVATFDAFVSKFGTDEYAGVDLNYYYHYIKAWADSKGAKYRDWVAAIRKWLLKDYREGKLVKVQASPGDVLSEGAKEYLRMGMEDELWPNL